MAASRAAGRATTASDLQHHGAAYSTATVRAENKTLARGTQLQVWGVECTGRRHKLAVSEHESLVTHRLPCPGVETAGVRV